VRRRIHYISVQDELVAAANQTGLEVEVTSDLGKLPFKEMVAKMAETGILIAAHGAALVNALFLPQVSCIKCSAVRVALTP
jgi:capsular polysaccharide biosynthesis protein